jgi:hypothetical protein
MRAVHEHKRAIQSTYYRIMGRELAKARSDLLLAILMIVGSSRGFFSNNLLWKVKRKLRGDLAPLGLVLRNGVFFGSVLLCSC